MYVLNQLQKWEEEFFFNFFFFSFVYSVSFFIKSVFDTCCSGFGTTKRKCFNKRTKTTRGEKKNGAKTTKHEYVSFISSLIIIINSFFKHRHRVI